MSKNTHEAVREKLLAEYPEVKEEYDRLKPRYAVISKLIQARHDLNLTQAQLAERMGTTQNTVSRLESGETDPRFGTLVRAAQAMGRELQVEFA